MADRPEIQETIPVIEERASLHKRTIETGRVRIRTVVEESERWFRETLEREAVLVTRVPVDREVEAMPQMHEEGDTLIIPIVEEVLTVQKQLVLKEEVHIRRQRKTETVEAPVTLRSMRAVVERERRAHEESEQPSENRGDAHGDPNPDGTV